MGSSTQTSSTTTGPQNKDVNALLSTLAKGINTSYQPGGTTYVAPGSTTTGSWADMLTAANNSDFSGGLAGALSSYSNRAAGNELGQSDPSYAALRQRAIDDAITGTTAQFSGNGLFGSDRNQKLAAEGAGNAALGFDYKQYQDSMTRQAEAAKMLPELLQSSLMPSSVTGAVGASQDADAQARAGGGLDYLKQFTSILGGVSAAGPQTTTTKQPSTPLWQSLLGLGISAL